MSCKPSLRPVVLISSFPVDSAPLSGQLRFSSLCERSLIALVSSSPISKPGSYCSSHSRGRFRCRKRVLWNGDAGAYCVLVFVYKRGTWSEVPPLIVRVNFEGNQTAELIAARPGKLLVSFFWRFIAKWSCYFRLKLHIKHYTNEKGT